MTTVQKFKTIREIHDGFDKKAVSPTELVSEYLKVAKSSRANAFLTLCEERALQQAKAAEAILAKEGKVPREKMPLLGIPLGIKDNMTVDGVRTTCASKVLENYFPPYTATAVQRLEDAGAVCVGKLNLDEFAMGGSNENSAFGPVKHPTHPDRVPGGSSGGSATAVGEHACVAALGSDTGGSIRLPASYCGVIGVKPTYGRVSRYGLVAFASSLDQIGPMTHTVEDAAIVLDVMSGHDPLDSTSAPQPKTQTREALRSPVDWKGLRIGVPKEYFAGRLASSVGKAVEASLKFFETQGAKLIPISLPHSQYSVAIYYIVAVSEASSNLARYDGVRFGVRPKGTGEAKDLKEFYEKVRANFGPEVKRRIILGTFALSAGYSEAYYKRACQVRRKIKDDFDRAFEKVDLIAGPVSPTTAFKLGEKVSDPLEMYLNDLFTIPANLAGIPAMSVPCGKDSADLPIGLQLMAPAFGEDRLFSVAQGFATGFEAGRY
jgi:aspartyl-tRNA(Asn)/glutamyl-tRNA(Gln) amidotransferase subunit A